MLDLEKPLKKETTLKNKGVMFKVRFKFERLMDFCYGCGKIRHLLKDCTYKTLEEEGDLLNLSFGQWMRASPTRIRQIGGGVQ